MGCLSALKPYLTLDKLQFLCYQVWYQEWLLPAFTNHLDALTLKIFDYFGIAGYLIKGYINLKTLKQQLSNTEYFDFDQHRFLRRKRLDKALFTFLDLASTLAASIGYFIYHAAWATPCFGLIGLTYFAGSLYSLVKNFRKLKSCCRQYNAHVRYHDYRNTLHWRRFLFAKKPHFDHINDYSLSSSLPPTPAQIAKITFQRHQAKLQKSIVDMVFTTVLIGVSCTWIINPALAIGGIGLVSIIWMLVRRKYKQTSIETKATAIEMSTRSEAIRNPVVVPSKPDSLAPHANASEPASAHFNTANPPTFWNRQKQRLSTLFEADPYSEAAREQPPFYLPLGH